MRLLSKILFATDFSKSSTAALQTVKVLVRTFHSRVVLLHVVPEDEGKLDSADTVSYIRMAVKRGAELLARDRVSIVKAGGVVQDPIVRTGTPFDQIVRQANMQDVDVVIIGAGGRDADERHPLGSSAERVVRASDKPVWVVKPGVAAAVERVLCPVDLSPSSTRTFANAIHLARHLDAELTVLHVVHPVSSSYFGLFHKAKKEPSAHSREAREAFDAFFGDFDFHDVNLERVVREGKPHREILSVAAENRTDLIVMGSVGKPGLEPMLLGGVARKVLREIPCSVVTFKPERFTRMHLEAKISEIEGHFKDGYELLEKKSAKEALREFEYCVGKDLLNAPAWEGMADANEILGRKEEAERYRARASRLRRAFRLTRKRGAK